MDNDDNDSSHINSTVRVIVRVIVIVIVVVIIISINMLAADGFCFSDPAP